MNDKNKSVADWLIFVESDLKSAEALFSEEIYNEVCFHAQQSVEKILKALLVLLGEKVPKTHDLLYLYEKLKSDEYVRQIRPELGYLNRFYIPTRYPDTFPGSLPEGLPNREDAQKALEYAKEIVERVKPKLTQSGFAPVILILTIAALAGLIAGAFYLGKQTNKSANVSQVTISVSPTATVSTQDPTASPASALKTDETTGWKIYKNSAYGFEFKYPPNFQNAVAVGLGQGSLNVKPVVEMTSETFSSLHNQIDAYLTVLVKDNGQAECEYVPRGAAGTLGSKVINGVNFTTFSTGGAAAGNTYANDVYHHLKGTACYEIVATIYEGGDGSTPEAMPKINEQKARLKGQLDQILSTFKFIEPKTDIEWIRYKNNQLQISFDYPQTWFLHEITKDNDKTMIIKLSYPVDSKLVQAREPGESSYLQIFRVLRNGKILAERLRDGADPARPLDDFEKEIVDWKGNKASLRNYVPEEGSFFIELERGGYFYFINGSVFLPAIKNQDKREFASQRQTLEKIINSIQFIR